MNQFPERKHLNFESLMAYAKDKFSVVTDIRQKSKTDYTMEEMLTSAFGCFYFQEPSFLQYQLKMKEEASKSNISSILGIENIPKESQLKDALNTVDYKDFSVINKEFISRLQRGKVLEKFSFFENKLLVPLDGTQFFSSGKISCENCLKKEHKNGKISYSHQALQATIVHPDLRHVLPFMAEEISNTDGSTKQDCEQNASKRLLDRLKATYPRFDFIIGGDDLYSREPTIRRIIKHNWSYIFTAKHSSHKIMKEYLDNNPNGMRLLTRKDKKTQKKFVYEWMENVPLTGNKEAEIVNYFSLKIVAPSGKINYFCSWVTNLSLSEEFIEDFVRAGRARWKIENECFNNLKNRGYHLEHNFGHGKKLSFVLYNLLVLAFLMHQIFELTDLLYQNILKKFSQKKLVWGKITFSVNAIYFESWRNLLEFIYDRDKFKVVPI